MVIGPGRPDTPGCTVSSPDLVGKSLAKRFTMLFQKNKDTLIKIWFYWQEILLYYTNNLSTQYYIKTKRCAAVLSIWAASLSRQSTYTSCTTHKRASAAGVGIEPTLSCEHEIPARLAIQKNKTKTIGVTTQRVTSHGLPHRHFLRTE